MNVARLWIPITSLKNVTRPYFLASLSLASHAGDNVHQTLFLHRSISYFKGTGCTCTCRTLSVFALKKRQKNALVSKNFSNHIPFTNESVSVENGDTKTRRTIDQVVYHLQADLRRKRRIHKADIHNAIELAEQVTSVENYGTFLLNCCCDVLPDLHPSYRVEMAKRIWAVIQAHNERSSAHFEAMLKVLATNEDKTMDPFIFLDEAKQFDVNPTATMYFFATLIVCQRGDLEAAVKILNIMKENMVPVNEKFFNALMIGNARSGDHKAAMDILEIMKASQIEPKINTWSTLLNLHIELGDLKQLQTAFSDAVGSQLTEDQFYDLLKTAGKQNRSEVLDLVIQRALDFRKMHTRTVMNLIVQLLCLGYGKSALKLLLQFKDILLRKNEPLGTFFIRELSSSTPIMNNPEVYLDLVTTLQGQNRNPYALNMAAESCLKAKKFEMACMIFECMLSMDIPIRPHYYLPIFIDEMARNGTTGGLNVLKKMRTHNVQPDWELLINWVVPELFRQETSLPAGLKAIKEVCGLSYSSSGLISAGLIVALQERKLNQVIAFVQTIKGKLLHPELVMQSLLSYTRNMEGQDDTPSITKLIKYVSDNKPTHDRQDYTGNFIVKLLESDRIIEAKSFLAAIIELQLPVSEQATEIIKDTIVNFNDPLNIDENLLLEQYCNEITGRHIQHISKMNTFSLECHKQELESKGMNARGIARKLFLKYCREGDFEKAMEIKNSFEQNFGSISRGMQLALLGIYIKHEILESALELFKELTRDSEKNSDVTIDVYKIIDLATLLAKKGKLEEAIKLIYEECPSRKVDRPETVSRNIVTLLEAISKLKNGHVNDLTGLFLQLGFINPTNATLGPSIRYLIRKDDLDGAIELLEQYAELYSISPGLQELTYAVLGKPFLLDRLFKCSVATKGEREAKRMLALAKADIGDIEGSAKILRELGSNLSFVSILKQCEYLSSKKQIEKVLNLIKAIQKTDKNYDCKKLYNIAVRACQQSGDKDGLNRLFSSMEENDMYIAPALRELGSQS